MVAPHVPQRHRAFSGLLVVVPVPAALKALDLLQYSSENQWVSAAQYSAGMENGMGMDENCHFLALYIPT